MKIRAFLLLHYIVLSLTLHAQEPVKQMPFILLIDNDIPVNNIYDGFFSIIDSGGVVKDRIPFDYRVGNLLISPSDYTKLFSLSTKGKVSINFKYSKIGPNSSEVYKYKKEIPAEWLNEKYMIFKVYNFDNKDSRGKYALKRDQYGIEVSVPGAGSVIPKRRF
jgi:hypothetical protein